MFYEESLVSDLLKCQLCSEKLDEDSRILECGKTVCNKCGSIIEATILNQTDSDRFKCSLCFKEHMVFENGLVRNEILVSLIKEKPGNILNEVSRFYKESAISNINNCQQCNQPFDPYEPAKVLSSTGKTICNKCLNIKKPKNDILIENELLFDLLCIQPKQMYRGEKNEQLKASLKNVESLVNDLEFNCENGELKIRDYCDEQRRLIQLTNEMNELENNDQVNDTLIEIIDDYEKECIKFYAVIKNKLKNNQLIEDINRFIDQVKAYFQEFDINETHLENLNQLCHIWQAELELELRNVTSEIFNNEFIKFNSIDNNIEYEPISFKLISASSDKTIKIWESESNACVKTLRGHAGGVIAVAYSKNKVISASTDKTIKIWDIKTGVCEKTIEAHSEPIRAIQMIETNQFISCSSDKSILLWDLNTFNCLKTFLAHSDQIYCVDKLSNDKIVSGSMDCTIRLWDISTGSCLKTIVAHARWVWCLKAISHKHVLSGSSDKTIKLWDMNTCECIKTFMGHSGPVTTIIKLSHPNNNLIASGSFDKTIRIWNLISEQCLRIIQAHQEFVRCLLALGGSTIVSCSDDSTIKVWNINNGRCLKILNGHSSYVYSIHLIR